VDALQDLYMPRNTIGNNFPSQEVETEHVKEISEIKTVINKQHLPISTTVNRLIRSQTPNTMPKSYILPYSIWEGQTSGANNLWQLQIWAKQVGMYVVEPFVRDSFYTMRKMFSTLNQALRFGDYFDKEQWDDMVVKNGGNPLVKWEEFITNFHHKAIILHTVRREENENPPLTIAYDENTTVCNTEKLFPYQDMLWIKNNFDIIKTVCYLCATNIWHPLSLDKFNSLVFSDNGVKPNEVTLIIANWIGIRTVRVHLDPLTLFTSPLEQKIAFPPSKRVVTAYKEYIKQYIGDHKYVGIVFRTHHVLDFSPQKDDFSSQSEYLLQCSKNLSTVLDKVRSKWKIFLAYDMGMFGSKKYAVKNYEKLAPLQKQIFLDVFNGSLQVNEREENLIKAANGTTDRGVIAQLEKVIATHADCIILLGPHSTFVKSSSFAYISQHHNKKCIVSICAERVYENNNAISFFTIPDYFLNN